MNSILKLITFICILAFGSSCQQSGSTESAETSETTDATQESSVEETQTAELLNPNLAGEQELQEAGLSSELTSKLVENRPFLTMTDLDALLGETLDSTQRVELYGKLFVPFNLNTAPEDDFKLIPGVGNRMAHEFEEYRPYKSIDQFRREIGKYVDDEQVKKYEQYVFVPVNLNSGTKEEILAIPGVGEKMLHEFEEYRLYTDMKQFRREIGKYVDDKELVRLERYVTLD